MRLDILDADPGSDMLDQNEADPAVAGRPNTSLAELGTIRVDCYAVLNLRRLSEAVSQPRISRSVRWDDDHLRLPGEELLAKSFVSHITQ